MDRPLDSLLDRTSENSVIAQMLLRRGRKRPESPFALFFPVLSGS
jgi:hypothetical protein